MPNDRFPRRVAGTIGQPGRPGKPGPIGLVGNTGPKGQRGARGARGAAGQAGVSPPPAHITGAERIELLSVVQVQFENVYRELDKQRHRSAQLETLIAGMESGLRELIGLSKWPRDDGGRHPTPRTGLPQKLSH